MKMHLAMRGIVFCLILVLAVTCAFAENNSAEIYSAYINSKDSALRYLTGRLHEGCPIASYETDKRELANAAYSYDNAMAALAFIAAEQYENAETILDSLVEGINSDRYKKDRVRNAYMAGDPTGLPGFWDDKWYEDAIQVGVSTVSSSIVAIAMLQYDRNEQSGEKYKQTAITIMDWVLSECKDSSVGFTAGYNGWPENENASADVTKLSYKSTRDNIAAYVAFKQLYAVTEMPKYKDAYESALAFLRSMQNGNGVFNIGTKDDGITAATYNTNLTSQLWPALALGEEYSKKSVEYALKMKESGGYRYSSNKNKDNKNGFWCEGTAFAALTFRVLGMDDEAASALKALSDIQLGSSGGFPTATVDNFYTGESMVTGKLLTYNSDPCIAPVAWYVMAVCGFNPFAFTAERLP